MPLTQQGEEEGSERSAPRSGKTQDEDWFIESITRQKG